MDNEKIIVKVQNNIMDITFNRPESLNAFYSETIQLLKEAMDRAQQDDHIRVVTLAGEGRAFCVGADLKRQGKDTQNEADKRIARFKELIIKMVSLDKPIIANVHGYVAGAGVSIALASDFILARKDTKFVLSFSKVGLVADGGATFFLPRTIGLYRAKELLFFSDAISVEKAHNWGIVNHMYSHETFQKECRSFALRIAQGPAESYKYLKKITNHAIVSDLAETMEWERIAQRQLVTTEDHKEGVRAFKEKRNPIFKGC